EPAPMVRLGSSDVGHGGSAANWMNQRQARMQPAAPGVRLDQKRRPGEAFGPYTSCRHWQ
ncbi:MAG TPA: hypothetical protein VIM14_21015, partial [Polyangia bacterium]